MTLSVHTPMNHPYVGKLRENIIMSQRIIGITIIMCLVWTMANSHMQILQGQMMINL